MHAYFQRVKFLHVHILNIAFEWPDIQGSIIKNAQKLYTDIPI